MFEPTGVASAGVAVLVAALVLAGLLGFLAVAIRAYRSTRRWRSVVEATRADLGARLGLLGARWAAARVGIAELTQRKRPGHLPRTGHVPRTEHDPRTGNVQGR